ncbi:Guanylate kinase [Liberibacter crescens BT-1]|uniref:Guanylate kinase n=1 Tax=Liberibacter crescens (strain BT-1) TaxID=1215343 RepID=L0EVZ0_LIBCB|nr:Guanylate kinase [Liberibacter crescens BT-1]
MTITISRRGLMLVISSPSGAGKSTITRRLLENDKDFIMSVSVTTRNCRPNEIDGVDYHFVNTNTFQKLRESNSLIEWAEVHGNFYGTPRDPIEMTISQGHDMLFDIDWQGASQLQENMASDVVSVFLLPPTMQELEFRLKRRSEKSRETKEVINLRLSNSYSEIKHWDKYDYVIINDDLEASLILLQSVIKAERMRRKRLCGMDNFIEGLLEET